MPSWDRPRGGGDSGGDKPPRPQPRPQDAYPPPSEANGSDKPAATKPEKTGQGDQHADGQADQGTDENAETVKSFQGIFEHQDALIGSQERQIGRLTSIIAQLKGENDQLKARLAEKNDQPGESTALLKRVKDLEADKERLERVNAQQSAAILGLKASQAERNREIASLRTEVVDLRAADKERDWKDRVRDGKIAEQAGMLEALQTAVGELTRNKDQSGASEARPDRQGAKERELSPEPRENKASKHEHKRLLRMPTDVENTLITALAGFGASVDHPPHTLADWVGIGVASGTVVAAGVAKEREHRRDKNGEENH